MKKKIVLNGIKNFVVVTIKELFNNTLHGEKFISKLYYFIRKFIIFIVTLGHTQNVG